MNRLIVILGCLTFGLAKAQSPYTTQNFNYALIDRLEITSDSFLSTLFTSVKPYREDRVLTAIENAPFTLEFNKECLQRELSLFYPLQHKKRKGLLAGFYKTPDALFRVDQEDFGLIVNPVLAFNGGVEQDNQSTYRNTRGAEIKGHIQKKLGFYSFISENQARFPQFLRDKHDVDDVVMGTTLAKQFGTDARDFFVARGYITFSPITPVTLQFGHDNPFIGNGYRSLILSDGTAPYSFLKASTQVWKLHYTNLYAQHTHFVGYKEKEPSSRKYSALHHLSINISKNLNIGFFENVIFDRNDSSESKQFDFQYYNPIIFYRAVEHGLNSSDNMVLGMDWKWNFLHRFSFYGQFILDEFVKSHFFSNSKSWVKKYGFQTGLKYINVGGIQHLDAQVELNQIRPHVYQHQFKSQNWIHYNQSLAHVNGSNLREVMTILRYQISPRLNFTGMYSFMKQGIDSSRTSINYGGDPTRDTETLVNRKNVLLLQGIENTTHSIALRLSYQVGHDLFVDASSFIRNQTNAMEENTTVLFNLGIRLNARAFDYLKF